MKHTKHLTADEKRAVLAVLEDISDEIELQRQIENNGRNFRLIQNVSSANERR